MAVAAAEVVKKVRRLGVFGESLDAVDEICSIESCWTNWSGSKVISKNLFLKRERQGGLGGNIALDGNSTITQPGEPIGVAEFAYPGNSKITQSIGYNPMNLVCNTIRYCPSPKFCL